MARGDLVKPTALGLLAVALLVACTQPPTVGAVASETASPAQSATSGATSAAEIGPVTSELLALSDCENAFAQPGAGSGPLAIQFPDFVGTSGYACYFTPDFEFKAWEEPGVGKLAAGVTKREKKECSPSGYAIAYGDDWAAESKNPTIASRDVLKALAAKFSGRFFACDVDELSGFEQPPDGLAEAAAAIEGACTLEPRRHSFTKVDKGTGLIFWECRSSDDFGAYYQSFDPRQRSKILRGEISTFDSDEGYEIVYGPDWLVSVDGKTAKSAQWKSVRRDLKGLGVATQSKPPVKRTPSGPSWDTWEGNFLYRWLKPGEFECTAEWCWAIEVDPIFGCPDGVYAEVNFLNDAGTVIDWSNDTIPVLGERQEGRLVFRTFERRPETAELVTLSCYD